MANIPPAAELRQMSFEQWQATREQVSQAKLAGFACVDDADVSSDGGYTYDGGCWIEIHDDGTYSALIANSQFVNAALLKVERHLYDNWYRVEGPSRPFAKVSELRPGMTGTPDAGFNCMKAGETLSVQEDKQLGLYVPCSCGRHFLDGQIDGDDYVGLYLAEPVEVSHV